MTMILISDDDLCTLDKVSHPVPGGGGIFDMLMQLPCGTEVETVKDCYSIQFNGIRGYGRLIRDREAVDKEFKDLEIYVNLGTMITAWCRWCGFCARKSLALRSAISLSYTEGKLTPQQILQSVYALADRDRKKALEARLADLGA